MPRRRKAAREYRAPRELAEKLARLTKWDQAGEYPAEFQTAEERAAFDKEMAKQDALRAAVRDTVLRERLETWDVSMWSGIFCERPEWEADLTDAQGIAWEAWCQEARRKLLFETRSNVVPMMSN